MSEPTPKQRRQEAPAETNVPKGYSLSTTLPPAPDDPSSFLISRGWVCMSGVPTSLHSRWLPPWATRLGRHEHKVKTLMAGEQARIEENEHARVLNPRIPLYEPLYTYQTVYTPPTTPLPLEQAVALQYELDWAKMDKEAAQQAS